MLLVSDNQIPLCSTPTLGAPVKANTLTIASLLSIILIPFHIAGDVALGLDRGGPNVLFIAAPILLLLACGTFVLRERSAGLVIMFFGGLVALVMPIIHRNNGFTPTIAMAPGGLFFFWTLVALAVTGGLTMILSARELLSGRRDQREAK